MPKTIPISLPLGSEISDQLNDAVRARKITQEQADRLQESFDRCCDQFGQLELRFNPEDGSIGLANNEPQPSDKGDEGADSFDEEGMTRSVGGSFGKGHNKSIWWKERFTGGKWVRLPIRDVNAWKGKTIRSWAEKLVKGKWVRTGKVESHKSSQ